MGNEYRYSVESLVPQEYDPTWGAAEDNTTVAPSNEGSATRLHWSRAFMEEATKTCLPFWIWVPSSSERSARLYLSRAFMTYWAMLILAMAIASTASTIARPSGFLLTRATRVKVDSCLPQF